MTDKDIQNFSQQHGLTAKSSAAEIRRGVSQLARTRCISGVPYLKID